MRFFIFLGLLLLAEFYSFVVVRSAMRTLPTTARTVLTVVYILVSLAVLTGFFMLRFINWASWPPMVRNMYIAFTLGFILGKVLILVVMLGDEVRRIVMWVASLFTKKAAVAEVGKIVTPVANGIPRSV